MKMFDDEKLNGLCRGAGRSPDTLGCFHVASDFRSSLRTGVSVVANIQRNQTIC